MTRIFIVPPDATQSRVLNEPPSSELCALHHTLFLEETLYQKNTFLSSLTDDEKYDKVWL